MKMNQVKALAFLVVAGVSLNACGKKEKKKSPAPQEEVTPQEQPKPETSPELAQTTAPAPAPVSPEAPAAAATETPAAGETPAAAVEVTLTEEEVAIASLNAYLESVPVESRKAKLEEDVVNAKTSFDAVSATTLPEDATEEQKAELAAQIAKATSDLSAAEARLALFVKINTPAVEAPAVEAPAVEAPAVEVPANTETPDDGVAPSPGIN